MSFQIIEQSRKYDVIIIGSGAGGDMAAKVLSEKDFKNVVVIPYHEWVKKNIKFKTVRFF